MSSLLSLVLVALTLSLATSTTCKYFLLGSLEMSTWVPTITVILKMNARLLNEELIQPVDLMQTRKHINFICDYYAKWHRVVCIYTSARIASKLDLCSN